MTPHGPSGLTLGPGDELPLILVGPQDDRFQTLIPFL